jgi:hypothetical protein
MGLGDLPEKGPSPPLPDSGLFMFPARRPDGADPDGADPDGADPDGAAQRSAWRRTFPVWVRGISAIRESSRGSLKRARCSAA